MPLYIIVGILVLCFLGKPLFFTQQRPGLKGKVFKIIKFRTMLENDEENSLLDHQRLTRFGKFLRSTSLDELPELINVLRGDMSLVGPRPLLMEYLQLYNSFQLKRLDMRPGITGWAQVNGRNNLSWDEKFGLDVWYVNNHSIFLDFKILFITIFKVLRRQNITNDGHVTSKKFEGNEVS